MKPILLPSLILTFSPLKIDGRNMKCSFVKAYCQRLWLLVLGSVAPFGGDVAKNHHPQKRDPVDLANYLIFAVEIWPKSGKVGN